MLFGSVPQGPGLSQTHYPVSAPLGLLEPRPFGLPQIGEEGVGYRLSLWFGHFAQCGGILKDKQQLKSFCEPLP